MLLKKIKKKSLAPARTRAKMPAGEVATTEKRSSKRVVRNELGYTMGSDLQLAWDIVKEGGPNRGAIVDKLAAFFADSPTNSGKPKAVSTIMTQLVKRAKSLGFTEKSNWKLIAPDVIPDYRTVNNTPATAEEDQEEPVKPTPAKKSVRKPVKKSVKRPAKSVKGLKAKKRK